MASNCGRQKQILAIYECTGLIYQEGKVLLPFFTNTLISLWRSSLSSTQSEKSHFSPVLWTPDAFKKKKKKAENLHNNFFRRLFLGKAGWKREMQDKGKLSQKNRKNFARTPGENKLSMEQINDETHIRQSPSNIQPTCWERFGNPLKEHPISLGC